MAFCDLAGDMELAEAFLKTLFRDVLERCPEDMAFFDERIDNERARDARARRSRRRSSA